MQVSYDQADMDRLKVNNTVIPYGFGRQSDFNLASGRCAAADVYKRQGMAGSLGQGIMNMSGGIAELTGIPSNASMWMIVAIVIAAIFIATAVSGLQKMCIRDRCFPVPGKTG